MEDKNKPKYFTSWDRKCKVCNQIMKTHKPIFVYISETELGRFESWSCETCGFRIHEEYYNFKGDVKKIKKDFGNKSIWYKKW